MLANFVARELGYNMTKGWMEGDWASQAHFGPEETFRPRFNAILGEVQSVGFDAVDIWVGQLSPEWASPWQIEEAMQLLKERGMEVVSIAGWLHDDLEQVERMCAFAKSLNARIIGGGCHAGLWTKRSALLELLEKYDLVFAFENHPEKSPEEVLEKIGPAHARIGVALDTGWFATQGCDPVEAAKVLASRVRHVHLKDIHPPVLGSGPTLKDMGHETCALGDGVAHVREVCKVLLENGYDGAFSVEHEPEDRNPLEDCRVSRERLLEWLA
jgi:L-ribulose-5-phosphate 3-epimerase